MADPASPPQLMAAQKQLLLRAARQSIATYLRTKERYYLQTTDETLLQKCAGVFVTLWRREGNEQILRGCIGHMQTKAPLAHLVPLLAVQAATQDKRFRPVFPDELDQLQIEVSVLSPMHPIASLNDVEIGVHGLAIVSNGRHGLLLPQVAVRRRWTPQQFLHGLCKKVGLPYTCWPEKAQLYTFTTDIFEEP